MRPMSELKPQHGPVILRLIWSDLSGNRRYVIGSMTFGGDISGVAFMTGPVESIEYFDGWLPLPEECK
jgi:hypothetical protein